MKKRRIPRDPCFFFRLILCALRINLRPWEKALSYSTHNWKKLQPSSLNLHFKIKINLSNWFQPIQCSPEVCGRSTARKATRKQRLNCAMSRLGVSRYACITIVLLDRSFVTESSSEKILLLHYFNLNLYDLWQYRPRSSKTVRLLVSRVFSSRNKMTETEICWYFPDCRWLQLIFQS